MLKADLTWTGDWRLPSVLCRRVEDWERWLVVAAACAGHGPARLARELEGCESVGELAARLPGLDPAEGRAALRACAARAVLPADEEYPAALREIAAPPPLLFVTGQRLDTLQPAVAVVGSRACTPGGRRFAERIGRALASAGLTVVSGLARGIDAAAHRGALDGGATVAVLATGLDVVYPPEHAPLQRAIAHRGAVVSEFPPGLGPRRWHFPARNRVVSGLSVAVVVVEAGEGSGALITAGFAADQGREVFACTVAPESPAGAGVRELLREGARLVVHPDDLVEEVWALAAVQGFAPLSSAGARAGGKPGGWSAAAVGFPAGAGAEGGGAAEPPGEAGLVFRAVLEGTTVDEVVARTGLAAGRVAALLASLELDGLICDDGGGRWRRVTG